MIVNFSIQNFCSIRDKIQLSFEATNSDDLDEYYINKDNEKGLRILKFGLIYGANASGKTTILNALDFLRNLVLEPNDKKTGLLHLKPFLFDETSSKENTFLSIEFIQNKVKYLYELELNENAVIKEKLQYFNPNKALVFSRKTDVEKQLTIIEEIGSKIILSKEHKIALETNTLWNNTVLGGFLKTNIDSFELQETVDWFRNKLKPIITPKTNLFGFVTDKIEENEIDKNNVIKILNKADFNITDITINKSLVDISSEFFNFLSDRMKYSDDELKKLKDEKSVSRELLFHHNIENTGEFSLPYSAESAGTQRYYQLGGILELMIKSQSIFLIDEIESSLHPDLLKYFLLTFLVNSKDSQIIATTHHRELLMERDIFRNDVIWFTELQKNGSTDLFSLSDFDSSVIRNTSSVYNAYKIGKLGARPNLNDYFIELEDEQK
ncbi:MAG: ATP-binding protein [Bacteroidales bacterium]